MLKMIYMQPMFLAENGSIHLTVSQAADLGISDVAEWEAFLAESEEFIIYDDFSPFDESTWPEGFDITSPDTWSLLLF